MGREASSTMPANSRIASAAARLPPRLRLGAWLLVMLAMLLALGMGALAIATTTSTAQLPLVVGADTTLDVYRLLPDSARLSLALPRRGAGTAVIDHSLVRVRIADAAAAEVQEALPTHAWSTRLRWRELAPPGQEAHGHPLASRLPLAAGRSQLQVTVLAVDPALRGEIAAIQVRPPLGFKHADPRLAWLWWFYLWPIYALVLVLLAGVWGWRMRRWRRAAPLPGTDA